MNRHAQTPQHQRVLGHLCDREALQDRRHGQRIRIAGASHDAGGAIFRDWAGSPAVLKVSGEPRRGNGVANVGWHPGARIEQRRIGLAAGTVTYKRRGAVTVVSHAPRSGEPVLIMIDQASASFVGRDDFLAEFLN